MAGRISDVDIAKIRDVSPIETIIGEYVQLRSAGGGELKGLCPFHEEKTPSFHVTPSKGVYYCFGCARGGDTIDFVRQIEHLSFAEAVEKLAKRAGVELHYEGGTASSRSQGSRRTRLVDAHRAAVEFYAELLASEPAARAGREFLASRGFDDAAARAYAVGWSPEGWDTLTRHLAAQGFTREELLEAGLAKQGQRGVYDAFRGRLMFPIHDTTGDPIGFGARKLSESDQGPKYLNTGETPLYRKSSVLYGINMARREIGARTQAVIVEGYTDVMACHLAGVPTAVATCGTSLTTDHIQVLRRLLMDQTELRGEVIFTFDGDNAGQKAALRAFEEDARFVTQTFVAVEPDGLDPCELRLQRGDAAVRDLVARRQPLFEFKIRSELARFDLDSAEGRVQALRATAPVVASIRDRSLRPEYARRLAGWLGMDVDEVMSRVAQTGGQAAADESAQRRARAVVAPDDPAVRVEREALKVVLQAPQLASSAWPHVGTDVFTQQSHVAVHDAVEKAGGPDGVTADTLAPYVARVRDAAADDDVRSLVTALAVEPLRADGPPQAGYVAAVLARVQELALKRRIVELKGRLQRLNPTEEAAYNRLFTELIEMEARARTLREQALEGWEQ